MGELGVGTVRQLAGTPRERLAAAFGPAATATSLFDRLQDERPVHLLGVRAEMESPDVGGH